MGIGRHGAAAESLCNGQIGNIYKLIAMEVKLNPELIARIRQHSFRTGVAQDLLISGTSMPANRYRGRGAKSDPGMRYLERLTTII